MTDYGSDLLLTNDDISFTSEGDVEVVSGAAMIAQDIDQTVKTTLASLYWDDQVGSTLPLMINDALLDNAAIIAEIERVAIEDERVDPRSVQASCIAPGRYRLYFRPLDAVSPEKLDYDLRKEATDA